MRMFIKSLLFSFTLFLGASVSAQQQQRLIQWPPPPGKFIGPAIKSTDGTLLPTEVIAAEIIDVVAGEKPVLAREPAGEAILGDREGDRAHAAQEQALGQGRRQQPV